jgi:imidazolonepropionase-like amidohydrolase
MDHVKICIMHRGYNLDPLPVFSKTVADAIVTEAHALGLRVLAHAHWNADYRVALAAGVDALMHSSFDPLDDELVSRVRDAGVSVCPTLWVFHSACLATAQQLDRDPERRRGVVPAVRRSWRRFAEAHAVSGDVMPAGIAGGLPKQAALDGVRNAVANLLLLRDAGVPLAHGSDGPYGYSQLGRPLDELTTLRDAGLSSLECLRAATSRAADLLGASDRGVVEPGRRADFVLVEGDPVADLSALQRVEAVYRAGRRVDAHATEPRGAARAAVSGIAATLRGAVGSLSARWLDARSE